VREEKKNEEETTKWKGRGKEVGGNRIRLNHPCARHYDKMEL
jgi:hypothetical protein